MPTDAQLKIASDALFYYLGIKGDVILNSHRFDTYPSKRPHYCFSGKTVKEIILLKKDGYSLKMTPVTVQILLLIANRLKQIETSPDFIQRLGLPSDHFAFNTSKMTYVIEEALHYYEKGRLVEYPEPASCQAILESYDLQPPSQEAHASSN